VYAHAHTHTHTHTHAYLRWVGSGEAGSAAAAASLEGGEPGSPQIAPAGQDCQQVDKGGEEEQEREGGAQ